MQELVLSMNKKQHKGTTVTISVKIKKYETSSTGFYTSVKCEKMVILALKVADQAESMCKLFHCHVDLPHGSTWYILARHPYIVFHFHFIANLFTVEDLNITNHRAL